MKWFLINKDGTKQEVEIVYAPILEEGGFYDEPKRRPCPCFSLEDKYSPVEIQDRQRFILSSCGGCPHQRINVRRGDIFPPTGLLCNHSDQLDRIRNFRLSHDLSATCHLPARIEIKWRAITAVNPRPHFNGFPNTNVKMIGSGCFCARQKWDTSHHHRMGSRS